MRKCIAWRDLTKYLSRWLVFSFGCLHNILEHPSQICTIDSSMYHSQILSRQATIPKNSQFHVLSGFIFGTIEVFSYLHFELSTRYQMKKYDQYAGILQVLDDHYFELVSSRERKIKFIAKNKCGIIFIIFIPTQ